jgi:hydroxyversicolorone monooxygenase
MDVFVRTPVWFVDIAGNDGKNFECEYDSRLTWKWIFLCNTGADTKNQRKGFRSQPSTLVEHAKFLENQVNGGWEMYIKGSPTQVAAEEMFRIRTAKIILDAQLAEDITPKWSVGCR